MNDDSMLRSQINSSQISHLSYFSSRYFDFLDPSHSVFSRHSYYSDLTSIHPWLRHPCSRYSGIAFSTLRAAPCSMRTEELARPKFKRDRLIRQEFFDNYRNYAYSGVKQTALTAHCSDRLSALAQPRKPSKNSLSFRIPPPHVQESALQAHITPRIEELAKPRRTKVISSKSLSNPKPK